MPDGDTNSLPRSELRRIAAVDPSDTADRLIALQDERDRLHTAVVTVLSVLSESSVSGDGSTSYGTTISIAGVLRKALDG